MGSRLDTSIISIDWSNLILNDLKFWMLLITRTRSLGFHMIESDFKWFEILNVTYHSHSLPWIPRTIRLKMSIFIGAI